MLVRLIEVVHQLVQTVVKGLRLHFHFLNTLDRLRVFQKQGLQVIGLFHQHGLKQTARIGDLFLLQVQVGIPVRLELRFQATDKPNHVAFDAGQLASVVNPLVVHFRDILVHEVFRRNVRGLQRNVGTIVQVPYIQDAECRFLISKYNLVVRCGVLHVDGVTLTYQLIQSRAQTVIRIGPQQGHRIPSLLRRQRGLGLEDEPTNAIHANRRNQGAVALVIHANNLVPIEVHRHRILTDVEELLHRERHQFRGFAKAEGMTPAFQRTRQQEVRVGRQSVGEHAVGVPHEHVVHEVERFVGSAKGHQVVE